MSKNENGKIHTPRLCHVIKKDDFDGYGFNLHAEKGKPGQYIGKVDDGSPAETAGLKQGDRIIEVNGVNIGSETHKQVVQRIKAIASEVQLLVVDPSVPVTKDNRLVDPPPSNGTVAASTSATDHSNEINKSKSAGEQITTSTSVAAVTTTTTTTITSVPSVPSTPDIVVQLPSTPSTPKDNASQRSPTNTDRTDSKSKPESPKSNKIDASPVVAPAAMPATNNHQNGSTNNAAATTPTSGFPIANSSGLNLNMTAAELRAKLAAKKKFDPKTDAVDLRKKFEIVQKL